MELLTNQKSASGDIFPGALFSTVFQKKMKIFYKPAEILSGIIDTIKEENRMKKEVRTVVYDDELRIEAYRFEGIVQPFPNHFHEYYVIGFMEDGERVLSCKNQEYTIANPLYTRRNGTPAARLFRSRGSGIVTAKLALTLKTQIWRF